MKLFDYELIILKEFYNYIFINKYNGFKSFLDSYRYIQRKLTGSGEYLILKKNEKSEDINMHLNELTLTINTSCLHNGADFMLWQNNECIMIEGYCYENKWLNSNCKIIDIKKST